jgi:hypothetical protein
LLLLSELELLEELLCLRRRREESDLDLLLRRVLWWLSEERERLRLVLDLLLSLLFRSLSREESLRRGDLLLLLLEELLWRFLSLFLSLLLCPLRFSFLRFLWRELLELLLLLEEELDDLVGDLCFRSVFSILELLFPFASSETEELAIILCQKIIMHQKLMVSSWG